MRDTSSVAACRRQVSEEGAALVQAAAAVKFHLQPARIATDAADRLKFTMRAAADTATARIGTRPGLATTMTCIGFVAAVAIARQGVPRRAAPSTTADIPPAPSASPLRTMLGLAVALGLGIGMRKLVPEGDRDDDLLDGLGAEVGGALDRWARDRVDGLAHPDPSQSFGLANLIAMGLGLFAGKGTPPA
jgi:hypothetical protein